MHILNAKLLTGFELLKETRDVAEKIHIFSTYICSYKATKLIITA